MGSSVPTNPKDTDNLYDQVMAISVDFRRSTWWVVVLGTALAIALIIIVFQARALDTRDQDESRQIDKQDCRAGALAEWADGVVAVLSDEIAVTEVESLADAYEDCE